ncbi:prepilin-type N-terminal cleavage/methylation domain-containing protein [bacterium]|nr:prepilin-type N-terminal cleavage/methylation domain-containing protein [bacterium]
MAKTHGFSLIELLVVICIISIMTGFAAVSLEPLWKKHELRLAVTDLKGQIQILRTKAILQQKTYQIKFSGPDLFFRRNNGNQWENWTRRELNAQVQFSMSGTCQFYSKGFASPKTIELAHNNYKQNLIVNINGRVRTSEIY